ncbi:Peptide-N(4)-(N-acetyl-beta-D-glucosaminyl)asparagine amidase F precursor [Enhygromyxa salina]|uniref:Peptide-N(4)-(N-acetyl-beta-D-glucosaminyl)asparagine amidase F n=1 Tax=Enhygromyxa salina TaxID=215803 RepID=A0A2S9XIB5_9BACT|nr:peptide-N-glycosidase F-related protein [Enhygromyxa salina]PRP92421.1 Peptide-N(4)-(N-acetyl-beta-D-glucosaminyl)asparagine amidase F precursor [Enhygromyxa salina]
MSELRVRSLVLLLALPFALPACASEPSGDADSGTQTGTGGEGEGTGTGTGGDGDSGDGDGDPGDGDGDGEDPSQICDELGLPVAELLDGTGADWGDVAGDFTVETTFGTWNLAENFSGCDSYVFVNHLGDGTSDSLRNSFNAELFERAPQNVHWFFVNNDADPEAGAIAWQTKIGQALAALDQDAIDFWSLRVHFVTEAPASLGGSLGQFYAQNPGAMVAAIDRFQEWEYPNSTSDTGGGSFAQTAAVLAYTPRYYNFRHAQERELAAQADVTEVAILDQVEFPPDGPGGQDGPFANNFNNQVWTASFPDAATMAGFDTMDVVVTGECGPSPGDDCGHWDYEAFVHWCDTEACDGAVHEVFRWITPYARAGVRKWVFDATPMLGLVAGGGDHYFRFGMRWNMNPSTWDMRFRLRNTGQAGASKTLIPAFTGNKGFNDTYNDDWPSVEFTPPEGATKVELVALISGHGQDTGNCAEWCNHQHQFTVNGGASYTREFPADVVNQRCGEAADIGVVPGQWGNWTPGRAGWCPGQPVQPWIVDITDEVTLGQVNTIDYVGMFGGAPVTGNRGRILLSSYVVFYE